MKPFRYERASGIASACASAAQPAAKFIAGGTNLIDLMKLQIETPAHLVDINALPLRGIEETPEHGLRIGALVTNSALAADMRVRRAIRCCRRRSWPARPGSFATRRPPAAICCSARAVPTSMIPPSPATNACLAPAARRSPASTA